MQRAPTVLPDEIDGRPATVYYVPAPQRSGSTLGLVAAVLLAIVLLTAAVAGAFLLVIASLGGWGGSTVGNLGEQVSASVRSAGSALGQLSEDARDRFDPTHPPRTPLVYEPEIEQLHKLDVGQLVPGGRERMFTLAAIRSRRDGAERPELSRYAVLESHLRQSEETKILGLVVRTDNRAREDVVYQGEAFRIGARVYKVNWISPERQQVALIELRDPDHASMPLKFVDE